MRGITVLAGALALFQRARMSGGTPPSVSLEGVTAHRGHVVRYVGK
jgi:hypothetical protein